MTEADIDRDEFLKLLTDALRAGPGSPEWRSAVQQVRAAGGSKAGKANLDDYELIFQTREHLASGKDYRSIGAGPGFTRKVMDQLDAEPEGRRKGTPMATLIATLSIVALVGVVGVLGYLLLARGPGEPKRDDLAGITFTLTTSLTEFQAPPIPQGWREIGWLGLIPSDGLAPTTRPAADGTAGGALVSTLPQPPDQPFAVEVNLRPGAQASDVITQIFITEGGTFDETRATSPRELVASFQAGSMQLILPNGRVVATEPAGVGSQRLRISIGRWLTNIDIDDRRVWSGEHQLDPSKPRLIGLRFLQPGSGSPATKIDSIRILRAQ